MEKHVEYQGQQGNVVGKPHRRLEGRAKVTGSAKYAADYNVNELLFGYVLSSTIARGEITSVDVSAAEAVPGVVKIYTHENRPPMSESEIKHTDMLAPPGTVLKPLEDNKVRFNGQPIGLVVAEDFETARYAASLVKFTYSEEESATNLEHHHSKRRKPKRGMLSMLIPPPPKPTGNFEKAYAEAPLKTDKTYSHSAEFHNPMELFAATVVYEAEGKLTIYEKTQGTMSTQIYIANIFGLKYKNVRVISEFMGGGFGSGLRPQSSVFFAALAAIDLKRNVRVTLDRQQMFSFGHRPQTHQHLQYAADKEGNLLAMHHNAYTATSSYEDYTQTIGERSHKLYPSDHTKFEHSVVPLDIPTPCDMRAPGGSTAFPAIECTMDELAEKAGLDPLEFRLKNYAEKDPASGKPFSSKALKDAYLQAAERFGWDSRNKRPGETRRGNRLVGHGMATGMWEVFHFPARAEARIDKDGTFHVSNATTDIGTGTYTAMSQVAADALGVGLEDVQFHYGDSKMPMSFFQGGSAGTASTAGAILAATEELKGKLYRMAKRLPDSPFKGVFQKDVVFRDLKIFLKSDESVFYTYKQLVDLNRGKAIKTTNLAGPKLLKMRKYALGAHSACFAEVEIDKDLKTITVTKVVTAVAAGKIINPKTAGSQILGSTVWGISKTLAEAGLYDERFGKIVNRNLAEYHIPVHADVKDIEVIFVDEKDDIINDLGVKGVGEIGLVAVPAAICNAIYNATGKRPTKLPFHFDELLD